MSQHPDAVPLSAVDPPPLQQTQSSEVACGLQEANAILGARPVPTSPTLDQDDQGSLGLDTARSSKLEPSSVVRGDDAASSPSSQQPQPGDVVVGGDPKHHLSLSTTPLEHFSHDSDTLKEGHILHAAQLEPGET